MSIENPDARLFTDFPEPVFVIDSKGTILDANSAFAVQFFIQPEESRGGNIYEQISSAFHQPDMAENLRKHVDEILLNGKPRIFEHEHNGTCWRHSVYPVSSRDDGQPRILVLTQNITGMKSGGRQLHQQDDHIFKTLLDAIPGAVFILDDLGLLVGCNDYAFEVFGDSDRTIRKNNLLGFFHPDDRDHISFKLHGVLDTGRDDTDEARMCIHGSQKEMRWFSVHIRKTVISRQTYLVVVGIDIDKRKQAEEAVIGYKRWLSLAMDAANSGVWDWNVKTDRVLWTDQIWHLFGLKRGAYPPSVKLWASAIHPDDREITMNAAKSAALQKADLNFEYRVLHQDGSVHWIMASGKPIFDEHGQVERYCGTAVDISEQKQIETELHRSRAHLDFALEKCHIGWWELNLDDYTVLRTLEHARIFGYDSLVATWSFEQFIDHILPEDRDRIKTIIFNSIERKRDYAFECRIASATGKTRWIWTSGTLQYDHHGRATHILGIVQDITARKREEAELEKLQTLFQQSQKMELVGQLAGGIAHDFNNALTAILGNIELMLDKVDRSSPLIDHINDIGKSAERSANLTRQLLAFARKEAARPKEVFVDHEIDNLLPMLRGLIGSHIQFLWKPDAREHCVHIDPSQLDQIIVNLCINSRDAITEHGIITIETDTEHISQADCALGHPCIIAGDYVRIMITDTGSGIDLKTLPHIFEPFFTTKEVGKGTGLGLSTVYGVLKQNHGFIDCRTEPGWGTTFIVYLPEHDAACRQNGTENREPTGQHTSATILLVEDEQSILRILSGLLQEKGYTTLAAQDAITAIRTAEHYLDDINLLVTDIVLPDMNGVRLSDHLQATRPGIKTLFMSGYAQELIVHYNKLAEGINFIQKPFPISTFMNMVAQMLSSSINIEPRPYRSRSG